MLYAIIARLPTVSSGDSSLTRVAPITRLQIHRSGVVLGVLVRLR